MVHTHVEGNPAATTQTSNIFSVFTSRLFYPKVRFGKILREQPREVRPGMAR